MKRFSLKRKDGSLVPDLGWNSKAEAETWIQQHLRENGGLDFRVGGLVKARCADQVEVVWSKDLKSVNWLNVKPL